MAQNRNFCSPPWALKLAKLWCRWKNVSILRIAVHVKFVVPFYRLFFKMPPKSVTSRLFHDGLFKPNFAGQGHVNEDAVNTRQWRRIHGISMQV
jgi:hypothetical protein